MRKKYKGNESEQGIGFSSTYVRSFWMEGEISDLNKKNTPEFFYIPKCF